MARYCFYIDGFNVYHALNDDSLSGHNKPHKPIYKYRKYKWLNYRKLALNVIGPQDTIAEIYYFTAYAKWRPSSYNHHKNYVKALRSENIKIVRGRFMKKYMLCHNCKTLFLTPSGTFPKPQFLPVFSAFSILNKNLKIQSSIIPKTPHPVKVFSPMFLSG
ncbi:hypothetical protein ACFL3G_13295 [Planctomycetota bacterium]